MSDKSLPSIARSFTQTSRGMSCKVQVRQFHVWLEQENTSLKEVIPELVTKHLDQKSKNILPRTGHVYKCQLLAYLDFLYRKKKIRFDPEHLRIRPTPQPLPYEVQLFMNTREKAYGETALRQFHKWLQEKNLALQSMTQDLVNEYLERRSKKLSSLSQVVDRNQLLIYLDFLYSQKISEFDPGPLRATIDPNPLPEKSRQYLASPKGFYSKTTVRKFHKWLQERDTQLSEISADLVNEFLDYRSKELTPPTWTIGRNQLLAYLDFLFESSAINFDPKILRPKPKEDPLPEQARFFLSHYSSMIKKSTVLYYTSGLKRFYAWLKSDNLQLEELKPVHLEKFAKWMIDEGLHPATRNGTLICLRVYFRWLNEHKVISNDADTLIKAKIFPKLPRYLPRPFPPKADLEMQTRLANSQSLYHDGLLLMRNTGVRIGELINLEFDCIQYNHDQCPYLKVPLGKLNNERLVPIDDTTLKLVQKLQQNRLNTVKYLLETKRGRKTRSDNYSKVLKEVSLGLNIQGPAHTHRLRHTFATSMLNGGMSLVGLMKILGHNDHRMTLRYSAITTETVKDEYNAALNKLADRYKDIYLPDKNQDKESPEKKLKDIIKWLQKNAKPANSSTDKKISSIIKRIRLLKDDLGSLKIVQESF